MTNETRMSVVLMSQSVADDSVLGPNRQSMK